MHVLYLGPFAQPTGYAQAAHDYMLALKRAGVSLEVVPLVECNTEDLDPRYEELLSCVQGYPGAGPFPEPTHVIVHTVPKACWHFALDYPNLTRIAITTWETTALPDAIAAELNDVFDLVIVPTEFCLDAFRGQNEKVGIIPHCFEPSSWPLPSPGDPTPPSDQYVFYSILGWSERKNPIGLLKAYLSEFSSEDDVTLRILTPHYNTEDVAALISRLGYRDLPELEFITDRLSHDELREFHYQGHAFVTAARGEGWNLPAFEAALLGSMVIAPNFSGHVDFLRDYTNAELYRCGLTPAITQDMQIVEPVTFAGVKISATHSVQPSGITARQRWGEPDLHLLGQAMRIAYTGRRMKTFSDRSTFEELYGYDTVGAMLKLAITESRMNESYH